MALIRSNLGRSFRTVREGSEAHTPVCDVRPDIGVVRGGALHPVLPVSTPARPFRPAFLPQQAVSQQFGATDSVKAERLAHLRDLISDLEPAGSSGLTAASPCSPLPFGLEDIDRCLPGFGLASGALHEIVPAAYGDHPQAIGFGLALMARATRCRPRCGPPMIVVSRPALVDFGRLYAHGLAGLGIDAGPLMLVETRNDKDALWAMEEILRSDARPALVLGLIGAGVTKAVSSELAFLTQSRRLTLAAAATGTPLLLSYAARETPVSASLTRWRVGALSSGAMSSGGVPLTPKSDRVSLRRCSWSVALERCRNGRTGHWLIEWDHAAYRFHLAQRLAHSASFQGRAEPSRRAG